MPLGLNFCTLLLKKSFFLGRASELSIPIACLTPWANSLSHGFAAVGRQWLTSWRWCCSCWVFEEPLVLLALPVLRRETSALWAREPVAQVFCSVVSGIELYPMCWGYVKEGSFWFLGHTALNLLALAINSCVGWKMLVVCPSWEGYCSSGLGADRRGLFGHVCLECYFHHDELVGEGGSRLWLQCHRLF